ncbi:SDR family oxidoreductase [Streptomyces noursei]|uniref:SDR family oxidoreductase n=1 Tax=Streptomyces noursei TaxID=1971 RepID=UPI00289F3E8C
MGHAIATGLARAGAHVGVNGRGEERVADAVRTVSADSGSDDVIGAVGDLATERGTAAVLEAVPTVDILRELVGDELPWDEAQHAFMVKYRPQSLLQRLIEPEGIANLVVYLASPRASATTGGAVRVDGGYVDSILP